MPVSFGGWAGTYAMLPLPSQPAEADGEAGGIETHVARQTDFPRRVYSRWYRCRLVFGMVDRERHATQDVKAQNLEWQLWSW